LGKSDSDASILANAVIAILRSSLSVPHKDKMRLEKINKGKAQKLLDSLIELACKWSREIKKDIQPLIKILSKYPIKSSPSSPVHGDIAARHIVNKRTIGGFYDYKDINSPQYKSNLQLEEKILSNQFSKNTLLPSFSR